MIIVIMESSDNIIAKKALADVDANVLSKVNENVEIVTDFIQKLQLEIQRVGHSYPPFRRPSIKHGGSAYECLAVKVKADFDVLLILGEPYVAVNFTVRRDPSGYFILRWNSSEGPRGTDLNAASLQKELFGKIKECVGRVVLQNAVISQCEPGLAAMQITIKKGSNRISIDLSPQIVCRTWNHCPDIIPLHELPISFRQYIEHLQSHCNDIFFFTPAVPGSPPNHPRLCNIAFSQLEKKFVSSEIRDMVRLAKLVAYRRGWDKDYQLKSFHLKRVALKYYSRLRNLNLWNGYTSLLNLLSQELNRGIDGYFVRNQTIFHGDDAKRFALQREITKVLKMNAKTLLYQR